MQSVKITRGMYAPLQGWNLHTLCSPMPNSVNEVLSQLAGIKSRLNKALQGVILAEKLLKVMLIPVFVLRMRNPEKRAWFSRL